MKKTFPLKAPGRDDARVRDKIRHEIHRDVRRQRRRPLPEGYHAWEFDCRAGPSSAEAQARPLKELAGAVDQIAADGAEFIYLEIVARPAQRAGQPS